MNALPENARQFAVPKHAEGKQAPLVPLDCARSECQNLSAAQNGTLCIFCQPSERNEIFHSRSVAACFSSRTFKSSFATRYLSNVLSGNTISVQSLINKGIIIYFIIG